MKDQLGLLRTCIYNEIPAVVFQGDDSCAPEILEAAKEIYRRHGCSEEFLYDWQLLVDEVKAYQVENGARGWQEGRPRDETHNVFGRPLEGACTDVRRRRHTCQRTFANARTSGKSYNTFS